MERLLDSSQVRVYYLAMFLVRAHFADSKKHNGPVFTAVVVPLSDACRLYMLASWLIYVLAVSIRIFAAIIVDTGFGRSIARQLRRPILRW